MEPDMKYASTVSKSLNLYTVDCKTGTSRTVSQIANVQYCIGWRRGSLVRTSVFGMRTFPDLCLSMVDI